MLPMVAGNWNESGQAGVFYRNWNNYRSNANTNYGFRAADYLAFLVLIFLPEILAT